MRPRCDGSVGTFALQPTVPKMNHGIGSGNGGIALFNNQLIIVDDSQTLICALTPSGQLVSVTDTVSNAIAFGNRSVYVNHGSIYVTSAASRQIYRLEGLPAVPIAPRTAVASSIVTNGFVIGASITDGGYGYTNTPAVRIIGGGGTGAQAEAVVSNGVVTRIILLNAGSGYSNSPVLLIIDPPFIANPLLGIASMSFLSFSNLTAGARTSCNRLSRGIGPICPSTSLL